MHATYEHVKDHGPVKERVKRSRRPSRLCPFTPLQPNTSPQFHYEPGVQVSTSELLLTGVQRYRGLGYLTFANTYKMYDPQVTQETRLDSSIELNRTVPKHAKRSRFTQGRHVRHRAATLRR